MKKFYFIIASLFYFNLFINTVSAKPEVIVRAASYYEELSIIKLFIKNIGYFNKYNYTANLPYNDPEVQKLINKSLNKKLKDKDFKKFEKTFDKKYYDPADYLKGIDYVNNVIPGIEKAFPVFNDYADKWAFKVCNKYEIILSLYSIGGMVSGRDGRILLLTYKEGNEKRGSDTLGLIIHEMIHIGINDPIILKYNVPFKTNERIVNKFIKHNLKELLPTYTTMSGSEDDLIDEFLNEMGAWDNLPEAVKKFMAKYPDVK
ncbi:MAG: hypothetical protein JXB50_12840 [Spirochaetes bacterium]|nr:hypothetical protein [Spirochaetota bacterium]